MRRAQVHCAYCGVLIDDDPTVHPMVYRIQRVYLGGGREQHRVVPWGRMHAGTCELWARRSRDYSGAALAPVKIPTS